MKFLRIAMPVIALFSVSLAHAQAPQAQATPVRYTMEINGLAPGTFEVQSFSWGMSAPVIFYPGGGGSTGRVSISSFNIMKAFDGYSTGLAHAIVNGTHFGSATVRGYKGASATPFLTMVMTNVMVESQQWSAGSDVPTESVSFAFESISMNGVDLSRPVASNPAALQQMIASLLERASKPAPKASAKVTVL